MTIAERIYRNETPEQIGISSFEYKSRWVTLQEFLGVWNGYEFEKEYLKFLSGVDMGDTTPTSKTVDEKAVGCCSNNQEEDLTYGKMFSGLARSINAIARSGKKLVDNETHSLRYDLCVECEFLINNRCKKCGCFMKLKTKFSAMECPLGKWEKN